MKRFNTFTVAKIAIASLVFSITVMSGGVAGAVPIQWTVASGGNGHWYEAIDLGTQISWTSARTESEGAGGYLATITSSAEDLWIDSNLLPLTTGNGVWLGGFQDFSSPSFSEPAGGWTWVTGEVWDFAAWALVNGGGGAFEPNNWEFDEHYLMYVKPESPNPVGWNDAANSNQLDAYIIEYDTNPIPEPNTALLLGIGLSALAVRREKR